MRTALMHRAWPLLTFPLALMLLVSDGYYPLVALIFPGWVLAVGVYFLIRNRRDQPSEMTHEAEVGSGLPH
jgi:hypothetical protein